MYKRELTISGDYKMGGKDWNLHGEYQVCGRGWATRSVAQASGWLPDSSPFRAHYRDMLTYTTNYPANERPRWQAAQGDLWGYTPQSGKDASLLKPFMEDHVISGLGDMVKIDIPGALEYLAWVAEGVQNLPCSPALFCRLGTSVSTKLP